MTTDLAALDEDTLELGETIAFITALPFKRGFVCSQPTHAAMIQKWLVELYEIRKAEQGGGWRPIESAPDSELVDLLWGDRRYMDCHRDPLDGGWRHMTH
jgi:hypothetical protein